MLKEKVIKIVKSYLKKTKTNKQNKQACWLLTGEASFAGLFGCSHLRGPSPALLLSWLTLGQPLAQLSSSPQTHRFRPSPSSRLWVCVGTQGLGAGWGCFLWCALSHLWSRVSVLHSPQLVPVVSAPPQGVHSPHGTLDLGLMPPTAPPEHHVARWRRD